MTPVLSPMHAGARVSAVGDLYALGVAGVRPFFAPDRTVSRFAPFQATAALIPNTLYEVRTGVTFTDESGAPLHGASLDIRASTELFQSYALTVRRVEVSAAAEILVYVSVDVECQLPTHTDVFLLAVRAALRGPVRPTVVSYVPPTEALRVAPKASGSPLSADEQARLVDAALAAADDGPISEVPVSSDTGPAMNTRNVTAAR